MASSLARPEDGYDSRKDPNYIECFEKQGAKDEFYDEECKYLEMGSSRNLTALDEFLETGLRNANVTG